jgi:guanylate kinase
LQSPTTGNLFTVSAPSGAGKTSLVRALVDRNRGLHVSVSHTTRAQRPGEENGLNYHFVDRGTFEASAANGEFFEWAEVFGNLYGTARTEVTARLEQGMDIILEIDWQGAEQVKAAVPTSCSIFIVPPSLDTLRERLQGRGQDDNKTIENRMAEAKSELEHWREADYVVLNDSFDTALNDLESIIRSQHLRRENQAIRLSRTLSEILSS